MRTISQFKLVILSALLLVAAVLVNSPAAKRTLQAKEPLQQCFAGIDGGDVTNDFPMDSSIVKSLKLDDYLFKSYVRGTGAVMLYIGYYRTAKKVGAAHDPLVCFTGQGWQLKNRESGQYTLARDSNLKISYSTMVAERKGERELIVYWFQANDKAVANTQSQKFAMVLDKFAGKNEDNAFVRISASIDDESPAVVRKRLFDFIEDFYPGFYRYVTKT